MDAHDVTYLADRTLRDLLSNFQRLPGSAILLRYVKNSYQNDPVRSFIELCLFLFFVRYLLAPRYSTKKEAIDLSEQEVDELVDEWVPEPLVGPPCDLDTYEEEHRPVISGPTGPKVRLENDSSRSVTNMASFNYFNFVSNELVKERAVQVLRNYAVGPCSPRNFYGTQDVHIDTEREIARFIGVPACIVYAHSFSAISSGIPAFCKRGDIIVADRACNFPIQKGIQISRSIVRWYEHNDMADLERVLAKIENEFKRKPLTRRFIITEGLFEVTGDIADLPTIVHLKTKYKYRLILDETHSFGLLGRTGRGLTEHQNVDPNNVEMLIGSMAHSLCSGGGFCAGPPEVVERQRVLSSAYVFSAALPAMFSNAAADSLKLIEGAPEMLTTLRDLTKVLRAQLEKSKYLYISSAPENPRVLFGIRGQVIDERSIEDEERVLADIVEDVLASGVLISRVKRVKDSSLSWQYGGPLCMATVSIGHSKKDVKAAGAVIRKAVGKVLARARG